MHRLLLCKVTQTVCLNYMHNSNVYMCSQPPKAKKPQQNKTLIFAQNVNEIKKIRVVIYRLPHHRCTQMQNNTGGMSVYALDHVMQKSHS